MSWFRQAPAARPAQLRVKLTTSFPKWPLVHQTPKSASVWKDAQFSINKQIDECDVWVVYDGLTEAETTVCPVDNVIFVSAEPPAIKTHNVKWLGQFPQVITFRRDLVHPRVHLGQTALPWHIGRSYDELAVDKLPEKKKMVSAISSNKSFTPGHQKRLAFVQALQRLTPTEVFGRGIREISSKWDGLADFRYSVAIENCVHLDYWTEKIADCFLAGTIPIYHGCPNIDQYFPAEAMELIELDTPSALRKIESLIDKNEYEKRIPALQKAKSLVLNEYNLFNLLADFCARLEFSSKRRKVRLEPEPS